MWFGEEDFLNSRIVAMREVADGAIKIWESPKVEPVAAMELSSGIETQGGPRGQWSRRRPVYSGCRLEACATSRRFGAPMAQGGSARGRLEEKAQQGCAPTKYGKRSRHGSAGRGS